MPITKSRAAPAVLAFVIPCGAAAANDLTWTCVLRPRDSSVIECRERQPLPEMTPGTLRQDPMPASYPADLFAAGAGRNITRLVRTAPELYAGRIWNIPLISPLIDSERGRELARSVMCGREPECRVELTAR